MQAGLVPAIAPLALCGLCAHSSSAAGKLDTNLHPSISCGEPWIPPAFARGTTAHALGHHWDLGPAPALPQASTHQNFTWKQMDELGRPSPFPTALLRKAPGTAVPAQLYQRCTLPALQLPAQLLQPQSFSHTPFTARAACDPPWTKAVQGPAQLCPTPGFRRNPLTFSCYREAGSSQNSTSQESVKTPHVPKALLDEDSALFKLYTPKQVSIVLGLPLLSTGNPMSSPKGDRQKGHLLLPEVSLNPLQWPFTVDLGARAGKAALCSHRHPSNSPKNKGVAVGWVVPAP